MQANGHSHSAGEAVRPRNGVPERGAGEVVWRGSATGDGRGGETVQLLGLSRARMPSHHTLRRILAEVVDQEEVERLVGEVYALDGKAVRGMRKEEAEGSEHLLSVYDVEQAKVMSPVEVGRKQNELTNFAFL